MSTLEGTEVEKKGERRGKEEIEEKNRKQTTTSIYRNEDYGIMGGDWEGTRASSIFL